MATMARAVAGAQGLVGKGVGKVQCPVAAGTQSLTGAARVYGTKFIAQPKGPTSVPSGSPVV